MRGCPRKEEGAELTATWGFSMLSEQQFCWSEQAFTEYLLQGWDEGDATRHQGDKTEGGSLLGADPVKHVKLSLRWGRPRLYPGSLACSL